MRNSERTESSQSNLIMELLPEDITSDILSRLPADSVLQCKDVCRAWGALIAEPAFLDKWMHRFDPVVAAAASSADNNNKLVCTIDCDILLCEPVDPDSRPKTQQLLFGAYSTDEAGMVRILEGRHAPADHHPPCNFKGSSYGWTIVGSCNGLICLTTGGRKRKPFNCNKYSMYVGNPLTREYVKLPGIKKKTETHCTSVGFGYCQTTNEYKAVVIYDWNVQVYTLGSGRWRNTRTRFLKSWSSLKCTGAWTSQDCSKPGVHVNGALYFYRGVDGYIVSFDLAKEEFRIVQSPPHHQPRDNTLRVGEDSMKKVRAKFKVGVLRGSLCLFIYSHPVLGFSADIDEAWVMDNEQESWTMKFSRQSNMGDEERIIVYDDNSPNVWYDCNDLMFSYVKSFVSVKDLGEKDTILM